MDIQQGLEKAIQAFYITASNGASFWAPYLVNFNHSQDPNVPRGLGKAAPEEIKRSADHIAALIPNATTEDIRQKLVDGSMEQKEFNYKGIDCSGFIFYVMSSLYQDVFKKELLDYLAVPKDQVLNGAFNFDDWKAAYQLGQGEADALQEDVPMRWVVETFKRKPVNLCNVAGLTSDYSSINIPVSSVRVGDLVNMPGRGEYKSHAGIVCRVEADTLEIAHSSRKDSSTIGGVQRETLRYDSERIYTEEMSVPHDFVAIRRLKPLSQI